MDAYERGQRLKEAREAAGFSSQEQLAVRSRVSRSLISKIENGERNPKRETWARLARALHRTVEYLMGEEEASEGWLGGIEPDVNANLLSVGDLLPDDQRIVGAAVRSLVEQLKQRRGESAHGEQRSNPTSKPGPADRRT